MVKIDLFINIKFNKKGAFMIEISICIATWNRKKDLVNIIKLLENQTMDRKQYEIIVVDSCSPDGTGEDVKKLQEEFPNVVYVENAENILAVKRNKGIEVSKSDIIVFMDDDVYPTENFVKAHYEANKDSKNTFFCGQIRFREKLVNESNYYLFRDRQHLSDKDVDVDLTFNKIVVMNLSFRKEFIRKIGGVNEKFIGYGCEDVEFGYRVKKAGFKIKYLPEAKAYHDEKSSTIIEYGTKLYKTGVYGERILKQECPEAYAILYNRYKVIKSFLRFKTIKNILGNFLLKTDKNRTKYSYLAYKLYLYACLAEGEKAQKSIKKMDLNDAKKGW